MNRLIIALVALLAFALPHYVEAADINYGYYIVPMDKTVKPNSLKYQEIGKQSLDDCSQAVDKSEPGTYVAKVQFWNRTLWGTAGAFAMYGILHYITDVSIWGGVAMGAYVGITSIGDYFSEKVRYRYNEHWYCMVLEGNDEVRGEFRFLAFPTENVPAGEVRLMPGLTRYELSRYPKYPLKKLRAAANQPVE